MIRTGFISLRSGESTWYQAGDVETHGLYDA